MPSVLTLASNQNTSSFQSSVPGLIERAESATAVTAVDQFMPFVNEWITLGDTSAIALNDPAPGNFKNTSGADLTVQMSYWGYYTGTGTVVRVSLDLSEVELLNTSIAGDAAGSAANTPIYLSTTKVLAPGDYVSVVFSNQSGVGGTLTGNRVRIEIIQ